MSRHRLQCKLEIEFLEDRHLLTSSVQIDTPCSLAIEQSQGWMSTAPLKPKLAAATTPRQAASGRASFAPSGMPLLHSLPDAPATIFLDFDGDFAEAWLSFENVITPPFSLDDDDTTFNIEEQSRITEIWQRVAEDFAPFNIDVTTEDHATTILRTVSDRIRTYYFRTNFQIPEGAKFSDLVVSLLRDDGAAVYLNGIEVVRDNLPSEAHYRDFATGPVSGEDRNTYFDFTIDESLLVPGDNVLAVEVHPAVTGQADVSFDLSLSATVDGTPNMDLLPAGAEWRHHDNGYDLGTAWRDPDYDDSEWPQGRAQFGFGDDDQQTQLAVYLGGRSQTQTHYFRHDFEVADAFQYSRLVGHLKRDDGAAVYLNGVEIIRDNLAVDAAFDSFAVSSVDGEDESAFLHFDIDPSRLVDGTNVLAAEVHQALDSSLDMQFDFRMTGTVKEGADEEIVAAGSEWRYLDDGSDQGTAWYAQEFDDIDWLRGNSVFGFGVGTVQVVFGPNIVLQSTGAGGYATVGKFDLTGRDRAWVLGLWASTASHEAGHTFGLLHQSDFDPNTGEEIREYSSGLGSWSPIMGAGGRFDTWHNGPTSSIDTLQDDMAVIASNGFGYRTDDHGDALESATPLVLSNGSADVSGIIAQNSDVDAFSFTIPGPDLADITLSLDVAELGPNLDAVIRIVDSNNQVVATSDPPNSVDAVLETGLPPGDYAVFVGSNGQYGRVGQYYLNVKLEEPVKTIPSFERVAPFGGLTALSPAVNARIQYAGDADDFTFEAEAGQVISATVTPVGAASALSVDFAGASFAATGPGSAVALPPQLIPSNGTYSLRVTGDRPGNYQLVLGLNTLLESPGSSFDHVLSLDGSTLPTYSGRRSIVGTSTDGTDAFATLVPRGADWKYLDDGSDPGTTWRESQYDDRGWQDGTAAFGYGDDTEATVLPLYSPIGNALSSYYFRKSFSVSDVDSIEHLELRLLRDEGANVYLNGVEVRHLTIAFDGTKDAEYAFSSIDPSLLMDGQNILAVEIFRGLTSAPDSGFDLELVAPDEPRVLDSLIDAGSGWHYLDNVLTPDDAWREIGFDDSGWPLGAAEFGYGDGDESTVLNELLFGAIRIRAYYFRKQFSVTTPDQIKRLIGEVKFDDGVAVYLNGMEVYRDNLAADAGPRDFANDTISGLEESTFLSFDIDPDLIVPGVNVLAVEVHQRSDSSSDVSFDFALRPHTRQSEVDVYSFEIADNQVGVPVDILLAGHEVHFASANLELLAPDGEIILANATLAGADANYDLGIVQFIPQSRGTYFVRLTSDLHGLYTILVANSGSVEIEPNDARANPLSDVHLGDRVLGYLGENDLRDTYSLELTAGMPIALLTTAPFGSSNSVPYSNLSLTLSALNPSGTAAAMSPESSDVANAFATWTASESGTYTLHVDRIAGSGDYELLFAILGDANLDNRVDADDWAVLADHLFQPGVYRWNDGDFNRDNLIDGSDFNIWNQNKFTSAPLMKGPFSARVPRSPLSAAHFIALMTEVKSEYVTKYFDIRLLSQRYPKTGQGSEQLMGRLYSSGLQVPANEFLADWRAVWRGFSGEFSLRKAVRAYTVLLRGTFQSQAESDRLVCTWHLNSGRELLRRPI